MDEVNILRSYCSEFLSTLNSTDDMRILWRGFGNQHFKGISTIPAVKNRKPKNSLEVTHRVADSWFMAKFGHKYRSAALFCTGSKQVAKHYGNTFPVFPLNNFTFCWSPKIRDLYSEISLNFIDQTDADSIISILDGAEYQISDMRAAISSGCEIMINAPGFYVLGN